MQKGRCCAFSRDELGPSNSAKVEKARQVMAGSQVLRIMNHSQETKAKTLHPRDGACSHRGALNPSGHHAHPRHEEAEGSKAWRGNQMLSSHGDSAGSWEYLTVQMCGNPEQSRSQMLRLAFSLHIPATAYQSLHPERARSDSLGPCSPLRIVAWTTNSVVWMPFGKRSMQFPEHGFKTQRPSPHIGVMAIKPL